MWRMELLVAPKIVIPAKREKRRSARLPPKEQFLAKVQDHIFYISNFGSINLALY